MTRFHDPLADPERQIAAMIHPPSAFDIDAKLPPGVEPGTYSHALFLEWADAEARNQSFTEQDF